MVPTSPKYPWLGLVVLLVLCFTAAGIGGAVTTPKIPGWYATLAKPRWNPPNWIPCRAARLDCDGDLPRLGHSFR
jgi:hypothetical protein